MDGPSSQTVTPEPPRLTGYSKSTDTLGGDTFSQKSGSSGHLDQLFKVDPESTRFPVYKEKGHSQRSQFFSERQTAPPLHENATFATAEAAGSLHTAPAPREPASLPPTRAPAIPSTTAQPQAATTARPAATAASQPPAAVSTAWTRAAVAPQASAATTAVATAAWKGAPETAPWSGNASPSWRPEGAQSAAAVLGPRAGAPAGNASASQGGAGTGPGGSAQRAPPASRRGLPFERWLLVGTLLFGVLFLAVGLLLLGRLLSESLRRKRYSRLDYLINGIYVDI